MCEEVHKPAIQVPKALVGGVIANFIAGLFFLLPLNFILPDVKMLANLASAQPVPTIILSATGNSAGAFCLLIPLIALGLICGVGCVTAASRCTWAFARDGAIPGSRLFKGVNPQLEIPLNAMMLGMVIELLLGLIYFGSTAAFNAFSSVGVIFLTLSYAMPVAVSLILRRRKDVKNASFNLGVLGVFCNVVCLGKHLLLSSRFFFFSLRDSSLTIPSMDCLGHPPLLYANLHGRDQGEHELRIRCVCRVCARFGPLVLGMGSQELRRTAHREL